jgi:hypothetical protein
MYPIKKLGRVILPSYKPFQVNDEFGVCLPQVAITNNFINK